jgi:hypothetical protein
MSEPPEQKATRSDVTRGEQMLALRKRRMAAAHPFLRGGFRPFFLGAGTWAVIAIGLWLLELAGAISLPSAFETIAWHRHEMLFGFVGAAIAGFLLRDGAVVGYGGNLDPDGFTFKIFRHLAGAYGGSREAFRHFIPEPVARVTRYEALLSALNEGRATVRTEIARDGEFVLARPREGGIRLGEG